MRISQWFIGISALIVLWSCSKETEDPGLQCGTPTTEIYVVGQVDSICVKAEEGEQWINFPETASRFDCGRILKSDLINYDENNTYGLLLTIPHIEGQDCPPLSPNAIQLGKYDFIKGNSVSGPGEAGFSWKIGRTIYVSWDAELTQEPEASIEVTSVEDVEPKPQWSQASYFKRVRGTINCKLKALGEDEPAFDVKNLQFSLFMIY